MMKRSFARIATVITAVLSLTACASPTAADPIVGTYQLTNLNGASLPVMLYTAGDTLTWFLDSGVLALNADGSWSLTYPMHYTVHSVSGLPPVTPRDVGTYTANGHLVTLHRAGPDVQLEIVGTTLHAYSSGSMQSFWFTSMSFTR
jgi:hypothetical protein